jgi:hypothetical protein
MYAHMYTDEQKYTYISGSHVVGRFIIAPISYPANTTYHARLNFADKTTTFMVYGTCEDLLVVPTLNITPANVREKLKLYLLFS